MRRQSTAVALLIAACVGIAASVYLIAAQSDPTTTTVGVCVKPNGQLRVITPQSAGCAAPEQPAHWTVGGEVSQVAPGAGLIGGGAGGLVTLAVDPDLIQAATSGKGFSGFFDGPVPMPTGGDAPDDEPTVIARLPLPAGKWIVSAKLWVGNDSEMLPNFVHCKLTADVNFDRANVMLGPQATGGAFQTIAMSVVTELVTPSRVSFACSDNHLGSSSHWGDLKITAIGVSSLQNGPLTLE